MQNPKTALVISAHAADFVWRCGGAIALHAQMGYQITVACLSFGERGESAKLWKEGKTLDEVKAIRRAEAEGAAQVLGVHRLECFDLGDYPLHLEQADK
ncbi:MAG: PIG-L family deacetylase, partial [Roseinatronobacter sp.]|nr:PIG-L family deacetylase [Roseinatronobacter sp.]